MPQDARIPNADRLAVRWTIGDVRDRGFELLRLSIVCAYRLFGPEAKYVVCVNTVCPKETRRRVGTLPPEVEAAVTWQRVRRTDLAPALLPYVTAASVDAIGWKLAPLRVCPDRYELAIDNDCILWSLPASIRLWLSEPCAFLLAEDLDRRFGSFDPQCEAVLGLLRVRGLNAGIRGVPPGVDLSDALSSALAEADEYCRGVFRLPLDLAGEVEEQGLLVAAMARLAPLHVVRVDEVNLSSPFWPKTPSFGRHGAHFVGMNARHIPWSYQDHPADDWMNDHWAASRPELYWRAGLPLQ